MSRQYYEKIWQKSLVELTQQLDIEGVNNDDQSKTVGLYEMHRNILFIFSKREIQIFQSLKHFSILLASISNTLKFSRTLNHVMMDY
jgi:hypothetical protein